MIAVHFSRTWRARHATATSDDLTVEFIEGEEIVKEGGTSSTVKDDAP
jgi:hypothetical protein